MGLRMVALITATWFRGGEIRWLGEGPRQIGLATRGSLRSINRAMSYFTWQPHPHKQSLLCIRGHQLKLVLIGHPAILAI